MSVSYCPHCGAKAEGGADFCTRCGRRLEPSEAQGAIGGFAGGTRQGLLSMQCQKCGAQLPSSEGMSVVTCNFCGATYRVDDGSRKVVYERIDQAKIREADVSLRKAEMKAAAKERRERSSTNALVGMVIFLCLDFALLEGMTGDVVPTVGCVVVAAILGIALFFRNQPRLWKELVSKFLK